MDKADYYVVEAAVMRQMERIAETLGTDPPPSAPVLMRLAHQLGTLVKNAQAVVDPCCGEQLETL